MNELDGRRLLGRIRRGILGAAALAVAIVLVAAGPIRADEVHLEDGTVVRGDVETDGESVIVQQRYGSVEIDPEQVVEIVRDRAIRSEYEERLDEVDTDEADSWVDLALWCDRRDLDAESEEALRRAIALEPDHAMARRMLGYARHEGEWVAVEELRDRGLARFRGEWMPAEQAEARREEAREERRTERRLARLEARLERERRRAERAEERLAEARRRSRPRLAGHGLTSDRRQPGFDSYGTRTRRYGYGCDPNRTRLLGGGFLLGHHRVHGHHGVIDSDRYPIIRTSRLRITRGSD